MKKYFYSLVVFLCVTEMLIADTYIKVRYQSDTYNFYGRKMPAVNYEVEYWIGYNRIALKSPKGIQILDLTKNTFYVVNNIASTFVEIHLEKGFYESISKETIKSYFQYLQVSGSLIGHKKSKKIWNWYCKGYELRIKHLYEDWRPEEREHLLWVTTQVPFDIDLYHIFNSIRYKILKSVGWEKDFILKLEKIRGFPIVTDMKIKLKEGYAKAKREVIEMIEKDPPCDVYSVPEGFTKQNKIMSQDINVMCQI